MKLRVVAVLLVLPLALAVSLQEDDLVFDDVAEDTATPVPISVSRRFDNVHESKHAKKSSKKVEIAWGLPDDSVPVGHVYKLKIPRQAFSGTVDRYEARGTGAGHLLPRWLYWDEPASTFLGVPSTKDVGMHRVVVKAIGKHGDTAKGILTVRVIPENNEEVKHKDGKTHCAEGQEQTILTVVLDAKFETLSPSVKVEALENLGGFLGLHTSAFSIHPYSVKDMSNPDSSILMTGSGNVKHRKEKHWTAVQWQVGCDGKLWKHQNRLVKQIRGYAKDGTLAEVLQLPVLMWRIKVDNNSFLRSRREIGSGDFDNPDDYPDGYDDYEDDYEEEDEGADEEEATTKLPSHISIGSESKDNAETEHPHRHHHGEESIDLNMEEIDEEDIVPVDTRRLNISTVEAYPSTTSTTTTELTTTPSTTTTTPSTTTSTTTTTTTTTSTTGTSSTTQEASLTTLGTTSTPLAETAAVDNTLTTIVSTSETTRTETTQESQEKTKHAEDNDTVPTNVPVELTTFSHLVTTPISSTVGIAGTVVERTEVETDAISVNTTEEETISETTSWRQPTTAGVTNTPTTQHFTTASPTTVPRSTEWYTSPTIHSSSVTIEERTQTSIPTTLVTSTITTQSPTTSTTAAPVVTTIPTTTTTSTTVQYTTASVETTVPTTTERRTTEYVEYRNTPPKQDRRLKKLQVTAGKPLSYVIPPDTFSDFEDGDTRRLRLNLYLQGAPLKSTYWLQFNSHTQEVYGLPLEEDVSTWSYDVVATDSEGLKVSDKLDIHVQMHKLSRTVNHEFSIYLKIEKWSAFSSDVEWELRVIKSLVELYDDPDSHHITVQSVDIDRSNPNNVQAIFTWSNDSMPRSNECPKENINRLLKVLVSDSNGTPSPSLEKVLGPEIRVKRVVYQGIGQCEDVIRVAKPEVPPTPTKEPKMNLPPVPRNQVDRINATVGQLLVYKVPEDTFFDAEDGSSRNMKMSLLTVDRMPISDNEWLQFDNKNQEFYGIPFRGDIGRKEYQLVVTDKENATATDGLVVVVHPAPPMKHTVEFSMTLDIPYESFANSAFQKRNFVERLQALYGDKDTSAIFLDSITEGSTVITWHNRTLPTMYCAHEEINQLRSVLVKNDDEQRSVMDNVAEVMGPSFPVRQITVIPMGICLGELTGVHSPDNYVPPVDDSTSVGTFHDDYLLTFILPAIIIAAMLILAGIIACVLYRRRRSGKMSVNEQDDERQSFRSKGIPVIFQDELDEKPDPGNKSPIILKEEKPPLPPPEYQKAEDGADVPMLPKENSEEPYQPPPPFATNRDTNRQNRPKPTPTYRKPPPYVPP